MKKRKLARDMYTFLKIFVKDPLRKNIPQILYEYAKFQLSNQALAEQYFRKCLYRRGVKNFSDYLLTHRFRTSDIDLQFCVTWDIAIQPDGPILIEGNSKPGLYRAEVGQKGFVNNPVFMELYDEITC